MSEQVNTPADLTSPGFDSTVRSKAKKLEQTLINQTINDIQSWDKACKLEQQKWQAAHPNEVPPAVTPESELKAWINHVQTDYYSWVQPAFERYLEPDPDALNPMIAALTSIQGTFHGGQSGSNVKFSSESLDRINDIRTDMGHWQGALQENFIDNFLTPLQTASLNMGAVADVAGDQLKGAKIVYVRYRKSVMNLLDKAIDAAENLKQGSSPKSVLWATLIGISVGTALTLVPGLEPVGALVIIGSTMGQGLIPEEDGDKNDLGAPTAQEVACHISDAMIRLDNKTGTEEDKVKTAFTNLYTTIHDSRSASIKANKSGPLAVARPNVDDASAKDVSRGLRPSA